eukprot:6489355-Prorocentrum_lima.AAC.1
MALLRLPMQGTSCRVVGLTHAWPGPCRAAARTHGQVAGHSRPICGVASSNAAVVWLAVWVT